MNSKEKLAQTLITENAEWTERWEIWDEACAISDRVIAARLAKKELTSSPKES